MVKRKDTPNAIRQAHGLPPIPPADGDDPKPAAKPLTAAHRYAVNAGRDMLEFEVDADDFEVEPEGVHFVRNKDGKDAFVVAFVSHPCIVREEEA